MELEQCGLAVALGATSSMTCASATAAPSVSIIGIEKER
jgi:hypothetical protein